MTMYNSSNQLDESEKRGEEENHKENLRSRNGIFLEQE